MKLNDIVTVFDTIDKLEFSNQKIFNKLKWLVIQKFQNFDKYNGDI